MIVRWEADVSYPLSPHRQTARVLLGKSGKLRVSRDATSFGGAIDAAFNQIRQAGSAKPAVLVHMLKALGAIAEHVRTDEQREALEKHAKLIHAAGGRDFNEPSDRDDLEREFRTATLALADGSGRT